MNSVLPGRQEYRKFLFNGAAEETDQLPVEAEEPAPPEPEEGQRMRIRLLGRGGGW
jgi:hypothetical protein